MVALETKTGPGAGEVYAVVGVDHAAISVSVGALDGSNEVIHSQTRRARIFSAAQTLFRIMYIMSGTVLWLHSRAASNAALSVTGGCCHRQELPIRA